jgi:predicted nucleic acid-binding protein
VSEITELVHEAVKDIELREIGQAFVKEFYRMQYEIQSLKYRAAHAEAMVERLIEAGERLSIHSRMVDDIDVWNALVAEWQKEHGNE